MGSRSVCGQPSRRHLASNYQLRKTLHNLHRLQAHVHRLPNQSHDLLRIVRPVRVVHNPAALVRRHAALNLSRVNGEPPADSVVLELPPKLDYPFFRQPPEAELEPETMPYTEPVSA
jgi:hypothetical protein